MDQYNDPNPGLKYYYTEKDAWRLFLLIALVLFVLCISALKINCYILTKDSNTSDSQTSAVIETTIPSDAISYSGHSYYIYSVDEVDTWAAASAYCAPVNGGA